MSQPSDKSSGVSNLSAFVLAFITILCVVMIGATGYVKYQLDRSETALAAPLVSASDQDTTALAANRAAAQDSFKLWGLILVLVAWCSLVLAASMSAGIYLVFRNRQAAPLRALAQSITNLSRGDMTTPIWGMERRDPIGELARAVDLARYHFSQLPDLSLMSEQGPVRLRFEGETRSLFQAMMSNIATDYERTRTQASGLMTSFAGQHEAVERLSHNLNTALTELQQHGSNSDAVLQKLSNNLNASATTLIRTQEKTAAELDKLVPYMQNRAQGMAEVTHIAGTKLTQTLQSLMEAEKSLRGNAALSQKSVQELATSTNQMSERLFAAVNLMQASGKILAEASDTAQSRFNEAVTTLSKGEGHLQQIITRAENRLQSTIGAEENMAALATRTESSAQKMETAVRSITERHESLSEQVVLATHRMEAIVASFDSAQRAMGDATSQVRRDGSLIGGLLQELRNNNDQLLSSLQQNSQIGSNAVQQLTERSAALMQKMEAQLTQQATTTETRINDLLTNSSTLSQQAQAATLSLTGTIAAMRTEHNRFMETRLQFSNTVDQLGMRLEQQAAATFGKTEQWASQSFTKLATLTEHLDSIASRLNMLGQLTGTLGSVAGQLGQLMPSLSQSPGDNAALSDSVLAELKTEWRQAMESVKAMRDDLTRLATEQHEILEEQIAALDQKLKSSGQDPVAQQQQAAILGDIVSTLARINDHVVHLDEAVHDLDSRKA